MRKHGRCHRHGLSGSRALKPTDCQKVLWKELRSGSLAGYRFRSQHPIGPFIVDFCCVEAGLVLEVDVDRHLWRRQRDTTRTARLRHYGYRVMRFWDREVLNNPARTVRTILHELRRSNKMP